MKNQKWEHGGGALLLHESDFNLKSSFNSNRQVF